MVNGTQLVVGGGDCETRAGRKGRWKMKETIRVEEEEGDKETREWKKEIEKTRNKIKELERQPPEPSQPQPGQPAQ